MMYLKLKNRLHIPNKLAMLAAILLLATGSASIAPGEDIHSVANESVPSVHIDTADEETIDDADQHRRRGINLGLLLFRQR